jgi:serine protease Do
MTFRAILLGAVAAVLVACGALATAAKTAPDKAGDVQRSFAPVVKRAAPAVVNIYTKRVVEQQAFRPFVLDDPLFRRFFGDDFFGGDAMPRQRVENSLGSGVIVRPNGLVVTNNHVIKGADEINVVLQDRREFAAKLVLADERTDLAVLRLTEAPRDLPTLEFMDSDDLEVGDLVLAIGNPFGVGQTVTSGIVSALARTQVGVADFRSFIQTDAPINPGNSGGALVGVDGRLVGINTAIFSKTGGSVGIGFAVPANMVAVVVRAAESGSAIARPWYGATGQPMTRELAASLGLDRPVGVLVKAIYTGGPADKAGLRPGDVVRSVDGREVDDPEALRFRIATREVGATVRLSVLRGGKPFEVSIPLGRPPETPARELTRLGGNTPLAGATVANLSPALAEELGLDVTATGVILLKVDGGSPAASLRFRPGDVLLRVQGAEIASVADLKGAVSQSAQRWRIVFRRNGQNLQIEVGR